MLFIMSVMDTLSYGVRTAGVLTRKLAMSLSLFNTLVVVSRFGNMLQAAVLGTLPDAVGRKLLTAADVQHGLQFCMVFMLAGVLVGAVMMPTFIRLFSRGLEVLEQRGTAPATVRYALMHIGRFPHYFAWPGGHIREYMDVRRIRWDFLMWNVLVTCFYSIGVMSTFLAAARDLSLNSTSNNLSGIVNGLASVLLFVVVDPPSAIIIDQCIHGKRPIRDAKILNVYLVITRFMGVALGMLLLPYAATYVHAAAVWFSHLYK
jgi:hypothetical protein